MTPVMLASALIPMSQEILDDIPKVDWTTADADREAVSCRYCKMVRTRYGRTRCGHHQYRYDMAWIFGPRS